MNIQFQVRDNVQMIRLSGRMIIGDDSLQLRNGIRQALNNGYKRILIDMSGLSYIDSTGIGELVAVYSTIRSQGGTVKLLRPNAKVQNVLSLTKLVTVFESFDDEERATASFS